MMSTKPILIAGPTASGKSALAIEIAKATGGAIINADSQQVYEAWQVLTARPTAAEIALAPHYLYGHTPLDADYSAGHWLRELDDVLKACGEAGERPIIVGGTGLYFTALTKGFAEIPPIPAEIRAKGEQMLLDQGLADFANALTSRDVDTAAKIDLENPRRVVRAWEVLEATGIGLADWQCRTPPPRLPLDQCIALALVPDRDWLYARCEARFDQMIADGALEEVMRVLGLGHSQDAPGMQPVGARELAAHLGGCMELPEAIEKAKTETRRYAKRQLTWIRNQMSDWRTVPVPRTQHEQSELIAEICATC